MKKFDIPISYQSSFIKKIKELRKNEDPKKADFSPTRLQFGSLEIILARHFGFCYGVENAIEISYKALRENPGKRIYLLSQMIHNPHVNHDLVQKGIRFIMDTEGQLLMSWDEVKAEDIVIIPAFGTTLDMKQKLIDKGIDIKTYNTTCPFVEKVWKTSHKLGQDHHTVIIHGKFKHEETRATFSHAQSSAPSIVVKDIQEARILSNFILGYLSEIEFRTAFQGKMSAHFDPNLHLSKVGVVNQTTMLASETHEISELMKATMIQKYGLEHYKEHFADTRDTLCYATNDNQDSTYALMALENIDYALVVGGYNSSNTQHLVELCEQKFKTYFIESEDNFISDAEIRHFNIHTHQFESSRLDIKPHVSERIIITSGASCPDRIVEQIILKLLTFKNIDLALTQTVVPEHVHS